MNRQLNDQLHAYADQVGASAALVVDRAWAALWPAMEAGPHSAAANFHRALQILSGLPERVYRGLWGGVAGLLHWAYDATAAELVRVLPAGLLQGGEQNSALPPMAPLLEDREVRKVPGLDVGFVRNRHDARRAMVTVSVAALDAAWQRDVGFYIPPGGGGAEIGGRRQDFLQWLGKGQQPIEAPRITIDEDGRVAFIDGRHRFSVLRDMGLERIPVVIDRREAARARTELAPPEPAAVTAAAVTPAAVTPAAVTPAAVTPARAARLQSLLLPPLPADKVNDFLGSILPAGDWTTIGDTAGRETPQTLAGYIANRYAAGDSTRDVAAAVLPYFDGSRVRAQRAARTFGAYVGTRAALEAGEQLGDLVLGYEVHDPGGPTARPDHLRRSGTRYWRNPGPGQWGLDVMPQPPLDRGGPHEDQAGIRWNCRCWLSPILAGQH